MLVAFAIILLRYWILPDIEQHHEKIIASFSEAIGRTVTIGRIEGYWQGLQPHLNITDVSILDEQRQPVLKLPRIESSVSWMSLFAWELRLSSLEINRPELLIRRDSQGRLFVGKLALSNQGGGNNLVDWLLHQSHMAVRDALVEWVDEQRAAPPLVLRHVNLHIDNSIGRHHFALRALPPEELASPLDVRGDFRGASFDDFGKWQGQIFTQIDFTDFMAWRHWLDLPRELSRGQGAWRSWLNIEAGSITGLTTDLVLHNVVARLAEDTPELRLANLRGRIAWNAVEGGLEVSAEKLAMRLHDGIELPPTDMSFRFTRGVNGQPATGMVQANLLQFEKLASLASYFPLEAGLRTRLDAYSPKGRVANLNVQWQGELEKPESYKIKGQFEDIALRQVGEMPGFSGLSVDVDGSNTRGRLNIGSQNLVVDAPGVMREPLSFSLLVGQAGWQHERNELKITLDNISVANDDLAGHLYGSYQTQAGTLGALDLTASLTRGDVRRAARYIPLVALNKEGNDWLNGALLAGHTEDFRVRIKGNLSDFPLDGTEKALLEIGGYARGVVLEFDKSWPRIENITGEFWIRGNKLEVKSPAATILDANLQNVTVTLPDMVSDDLPLVIEGAAVGTNNTFLQFIQQSPVRGYIDGFTDGMRASGNGHLNLFAQIPLRGENEVSAQANMSEANVKQSGRSHKPVKVSGNFRVQDSDIELGKGVPKLQKVRGELSFTESGMQASGVSAQILGGAANINVQTTEDGVMHAAVRGHSSVDALRKISSHPLLNYLHGSTAWDADIVVEKQSAQLVINSNLQGIRSSLPQPFAKRANEPMQLRLEKKDIAAGQDSIAAQLGGLINAQLERREKKGVMAIHRGTINLGAEEKPARKSKAQKRPSGAKLVAKTPRSKSGVWLTGSLPELSIQGWESMLGGTVKSSPALPVAGVDVYIEKLTGYGQIVKSLQIDATRRGDGLAARLASNALNGEMVWLPRGYKNGGKLGVRLRNLHWVKDEQPLSPVEPAKSAPADKNGVTARLSPGKLPALEMVIENLQVSDKQFGRFELVGHPEGNGWRLRRLNITNPDGSLAGEGVWSYAQEITQTVVNLQLKLNDAGNTLARYGYPNTVKDGSGKLVANLTWLGAPDEFNYASLNGILKLDTGKGRFIKMDPGAGKLLGILSLQALPSRITLDFDDVFSAGFKFDNINGEAAIKNGVMETQEFHIYGSAAKVALKGSVDLNNETQNLDVRVFPAIGDSMSLLAVFAINPAVGIEWLIATKLLGDPLDKLLSFEYNVSGTWSEPNVAKVVKQPVPYK